MTKISKPVIVLLVIILIFVLEVVLLTIHRYQSFNAFMLDIGNMSQAIWSATKGKPLLVTHGFGSYSRLAGHAEVVYFLIAPLYAIAPRPETLLIIQAILYAIGAIPIYLLANRRLNNSMLALAFSTIYLLYPVAQTAVLFDFHGDTLSMPFLLWAIYSADRRGWRSYIIAIGLALTCKYYIAVPVIVMGFVLWLEGHKRVGTLTVISAATWLFITLVGFKLVYFESAQQATSAASGYLDYYFGTSSFGQDVFMDRVATAMVVFLPSLFLGVRSPLWLLTASSIAFPALLGTHFLYRSHHYAASVPFLMAAIIYGAEKMRTSQRRSQIRQRQGRSWKGDTWLTLLITVVMNIFFVNSVISPLYYLGGREEFQITNRDELKDSWLREYVPSDSPIAATTMLAAHLPNRKVLHTWYYDEQSLIEIIDAVDYFVIDAFFEHYLGSDLKIEEDAIRYLLSSSDLSLTQSRDGLLLFSRDSGVLNQDITVGPKSLGDMIASFQDRIGLMNAEIVSLGNRNFRLKFKWVAIRPLDNQPIKFAVSRIIGLENNRILHLPSYTLLPTTSWIPGQIITEEFDIRLPNDIVPGDYQVVVGWYDSGFDFDGLTDIHNRLGDEFHVGSITVQ